jgi:twinkle protein
MEAEDSKFLRHEQCESCGSSDAKAIYSNGSTFCFSCQVSTRKTSDNKVQTMNATTPLLNPYFDGQVEPLAARGIAEATCQKYGVRKGQLNGKVVHLYPYYKDGQVVAAKTRDAAKNFNIIGDGKDLSFFGQNLFGKPSDKISLVVTEGEIDALSMAQIMGLKFPVVSVPSGAQSAVKAFRNNIEWLDGWKDVVIMFDNDAPGRDAAQKCAEVLRPGKARIASLPLKDANDMLMAKRSEELMKCFWDAKSFRPDGIIAGVDLWEVISHEDNTLSLDYPYVALNEKTHGCRRGELVTVTAGSGIGKSAFMREIAHHLIGLGETVGMVMLEESTRRTGLGLMGLAIDKPLHLSREGVTPLEMKEAFDKTLGTGRVFMYDHFGSSEVDHLMNKLRYMVKGLSCNWIILDHLSILVSGLEGIDERRLIDQAMTMLRTFVEETKCGLLLVSHLKRPDGKGHEEGAHTSLSQLRGSHAIAQLSDIVIGLERNQQSENPNETQIRVLKNRFSGETGEAGKLYFNRDTGRLTETFVQVTSTNSFGEF